METMNWFNTDLGQKVLLLSGQHLKLTVISMLIAITIAVPIGLLLSRFKNKILINSCLGLLNVTQTVPSLALIALVMVMLKMAGLSTIGVLPGIVALVIYALLPIVQNTYVGIKQVDPALVEVAQAMGMTPGSVLRKVEIPLALPTVMVGIRISTVWTIGMATLVSLIGAGGLGDLIFSGIRTVRDEYILAGAVPAALMALLADWLLNLIQRLLSTSIQSKMLKLTLISSLILCLSILLLKNFYSEDADNLVIRSGFESEFLVRPDGLPGLLKHYGFKLDHSPKHLDASLMYKACRDGNVDLICGYGTDGRIDAFDLTILEDDKKFFPPYYAAPLIREPTLQEYPRLQEMLTQLGGKISASRMQKMNYLAVRKDNPLSIENIARQFLNQEGVETTQQFNLIDIRPIRIGSKSFTEQNILAEIMAQWIETKLAYPVERKFNLGGTMICLQALKAGDLDIYSEYTGTGLVNILQKPVILDPRQSYEKVKKQFYERWKLIWLEPFGFNNTYTLTMRKAHADQLKIESISDLATFFQKVK
tara:strand:- start:33 stop:1640 length:1608 start_codon:yes stop_codon:yes gene_type:complete